MQGSWENRGTRQSERERETEQVCLQRRVRPRTGRKGRKRSICFNDEISERRGVRQRARGSEAVYTWRASGREKGREEREGLMYNWKLKRELPISNYTLGGVKRA